jgi:hypothetical protein
LRYDPQDVSATHIFDADIDCAERVGCSEANRQTVRRAGLDSALKGSARLGSARLGSARLGSVNLSCVNLSCVNLSRAGPDHRFAEFHCAVHDSASSHPTAG